MSRFRYPVDTDQFQKIREQGKLYVDKTDMMYNLASKYNYVFLARPRRFGKSLLCNTFKAYFLGQKELFEACPEPESMVSLSNQRAFYQMLLYIVFSLLNSKVDTEVKSILGRADVVIKTDTDIFVLELKVDDTVENALAQIDDKGYAIPYEAEGRTVTKCGVSISSEQRNITHWCIVDIDGNIIDEQKFQ